MQEFHLYDRRQLVDCAMGRTPADIVLRNGKWVCVQSGEILPGMDIAICQIDLSMQMLIFAGAKRPLYIYQNNAKKLLKILGDRKSIGGRQKEEVRRFTNHRVKFSDADTLYMISDGFVDQHNAGGKKFSSSKLESLLQNVAVFNAASQKQHIIETLDKHRGNEPQRDDITLIGVKFNFDDSKNITNSQEKL